MLPAQTQKLMHTCFCAGGCLSDYLARHSCTEEVARYFFKQLLDALAFCHSRKIVYRDIKPANVLITGTQPPFLKLCDFGLVSAACVCGGGLGRWGFQAVASRQNSRCCCYCCHAYFSAALLLVGPAR